jgi:fatty acid desaturase
MAFDALSDFASRAERQELFKRYRWPLLAMGVFAGYLGAAPSLVWSFGFVAVALAPILVPVSIWLYTLLFAFSSLWFTHFGLKALQDLRAEQAIATKVPDTPLNVVDVEIL